MNYSSGLSARASVSIPMPVQSPDPELTGAAVQSFTHYTSGQQPLILCMEARPRSQSSYSLSVLPNDCSSRFLAVIEVLARVETPTCDSRPDDIICIPRRAKLTEYCIVQPASALTPRRGEYAWIGCGHPPVLNSNSLFAISACRWPGHTRRTQYHVFS